MKCEYVKPDSGKRCRKRAEISFATLGKGDREVAVYSTCLEHTPANIEGRKDLRVLSPEEEIVLRTHLE